MDKYISNDRTVIVFDASDLPDRLNPYDAELSDIKCEKKEIQQADVIEFHCPDSTTLIWKHSTKKVDSYYNYRNGGKSWDRAKTEEEEFEDEAL